MFNRSTKQKGRAGEHYVAYLLEGAGLEALRVDGTGCDLHVTTHSGRVMRVEVKTCTVMKRDKNTLRFHIGNSNAEVFAFVSLIGRQPLVRLFERDAVPKWSLPLRQFTEEAQKADLDWFTQLS